jgi:hypothetical protein
MILVLPRETGASGILRRDNAACGILYDRIMLQLTTKATHEIGLC